jgi:TRAP-type C4-dicarboxylate transport system permease small subunit
MASDQRPTLPHDTQGAPPAGAPRSSWFGLATQVLNIIGTLLILAMAIAVNADIIGRNAFNNPLPGVLEFIGLAIVAIVFLQMANTLREHRHVSNDIIVQLFSSLRPRLVAAMYVLFHLIGSVLMMMIVWFVWPIVVDNYVGDYYRGTAGVIEIPIWPFIAAVLVGAAATAIQFLLLAWQAFRRASGSIPA